MLKLSKKQIDDFRSVYPTNCIGFAEDVFSMIGGAVVVFKNADNTPIDVYDRVVGHYKPCKFHAVVISDNYVYDYLNSDLPIKIEDYIFGLTIGNPKLRIDYKMSHGNSMTLHQVTNILTATL